MDTMGRKLKSFKYVGEMITNFQMEGDCIGDIDAVHANESIYTD